MKELYAIDKSTLDAIGNAIRTKKGTTEPIPVTSLADEILGITTGGGNVIEAGTYKMVEFHYGYESPGLFDWGSQELRGKINWEERAESTNTYNGSFTSIENDGEWSVYLKNNGADVTPPISPSWSSDYNKTQIVVDEDQSVSAGFKAWFDICFFRSTNFYA